jgi:ferrochelatase
MRDDGVRHAVAFVTSAFGSYSSCRQYLEDIAAARAAAGPDAPVVDKLRHYHDHPGYVLPLADGVRAALSTVDATDARLIFTAHSIPLSAARGAGPDGGRYSAQLRQTARLVAAAAAPELEWDLVWQSRSGQPHVPWLEPDINDHLAAVATAGVRSVVVSPIGFSSDNLEVVWDLDTEAAATAAKLGLEFARAATPGTDPRFVAMVRELIAERYDAGPKLKLGTLPVWDACPEHCCLPAGTSREEHHDRA